MNHDLTPTGRTPSSPSIQNPPFRPRHPHDPLADGKLQALKVLLGAPEGRPVTWTGRIRRAWRNYMRGFNP